MAYREDKDKSNHGLCAFSSLTEPAALPTAYCAPPIASIMANVTPAFAVNLDAVQVSLNGIGTEKSFSTPMASGSVYNAFTQGQAWNSDL